MLTSPQAILYRKTANLLTGDAYRAPPILLSMGTCMVFLVIIGGYVQVHLTIPCMYSLMYIDLYIAICVKPWTYVDLLHVT